MSQVLLNKVAVITGAGSGIGRATAVRFLAEGAKVVVFSRSRGPLDEIEAIAPARVLAVAGDVTSGEDLGRLVAATTKRFGQVDILILCAGMLRLVPVIESDAAIIDEHFQVTFLGAVNTVREFVPHLNSAAAVIFVTARLRDGDMPGLGLFNATKAALAALAQSLALELAPRRIRVNCLAPGPTATNMWNRTGLSKTGTEKLLRAIKRRLPDGKLGEPAKVADAALLLASDAASHIIGQELVVDGGFTIH